MLQIPYGILHIYCCSSANTSVNIIPDFNFNSVLTTEFWYPSLSIPVDSHLDCQHIRQDDKDWLLSLK